MMKMQNRHGLRARIYLGVMLAGSLLIAGCGGGADTQPLPAVNQTQAANYTGPAPATEDVQAFMLSLW